MLTVETIKKCEVEARSRDKYRIRCTINGLGKNKPYDYMKGKDAIYTGGYNEKCLLLSGEALAIVKDAVNAFDADIESALAYNKIGEAFYIKSDGAGRYDALIRTEEDILLRGVAMPDILKKIPEHYIPGANSLGSSDLYLLAVKSGDRFMRCELEVMFGDISGDDLDYLIKTTGEVWIPRLGEEYDRDYIVASETIDHDALKRSGFRVIHKPYYAMSGYTHSAYAVNPHTKRVLDAVPRGSEMMSHDDLMKLFER